jgi:hypothetical protein
VVYARIAKKRFAEPTGANWQQGSIMRIVIIAASAAAALVSSPAFTQQPSQGTASIPDLSGIWAHLTFPDVEPPLNGAGPVRNL